MLVFHRNHICSGKAPEFSEVPSTPGLRLSFQVLWRDSGPREVDTPLAEVSVLQEEGTPCSPARAAAHTVLPPTPSAAAAAPVLAGLSCRVPGPQDTALTQHLSCTVKFSSGCFRLSKD